MRSRELGAADIMLVLVSWSCPAPVTPLVEALGLPLRHGGVVHSRVASIISRPGAVGSPSHLVPSTCTHSPRRCGSSAGIMATAAASAVWCAAAFPSLGHERHLLSGVVPHVPGLGVAIHPLAPIILSDLIWPALYLESTILYLVALRSSECLRWDLW